MAQTDWGDTGSNLATSAVARGVTAGITPPSGGGSFVYGFNSLDGTSIGGVCKYVDLANFNPTGTGPAVADGGGSIRGAIKRVSSTATTGFSAFLFFASQGTSINDTGYLLGLSNADPYEIVLVKGSLVSGIPETGDSRLRVSSAEFNMADDLWHHLRLDVIVQPNGDVLLKVYSSDLSANPVTAPSWAAIAGMTDYIDDKLQINTGSAPLLGGYCGFGYQVNEAINRRAAVDAIEAYRAT